MARARSQPAEFRVPEHGRFAEADRRLLANFRAYHAAHPALFLLFQHHARIMQAQSLDGTVAGWAVAQSLRHVVGEHFTNDYTALYTRLCDHYFPGQFYFNNKPMKRERAETRRARARANMDEGVEEDRQFPRSDWVQAVHDGYTWLSYMDWVARQRAGAP